MKNLIAGRYIRNDMKNRNYKYLLKNLSTKPLLCNHVINCVYFITDGKYTKIGIANNLMKRLGSLQTGNPNELKVMFVIPNLDKFDMPKYEQFFHKKFEDKRLKGEWFDLDSNDFEYIIVNNKDKMCEVL